MYLMDVVATYLYGSLDINIYMKNLKGFKMQKLVNHHIILYIR